MIIEKTIIAAFFMMIAMTEIVLAASIGADPAVLTINQGETGTQKVTIPANSQSFEVTGKGFDVGTTFLVMINGVERTSVSGPWSQSQTFTVIFKNDKGAPTGNYIIEYRGPYINGTFTRTVAIQANTAIPEFPLVALTTATVLGLVFFSFIRREELEEMNHEND
jgi:hypothetical protein